MTPLSVQRVLTYRPHVWLLVFLLVMARARSFPEAKTELILAAIGFSSLMAFIYLFNKWTDIEEDRINTPAGALDPAKRDRMFYGALCCLALPPFFLFHNFYLLLIYFAVGGIGFLYIYKIHIKGKPFRLKDKFLVKNISSAVIWASPPAFGPAAVRGHDFL